MKRSHWGLIASLYVTQFLPVAFFFMGLPAILRKEGMALEQLGVLYLLGFVWVLKILWAPLVDRVGFGRLGHHRGWLILTQGAMILMLLLIGQTDGIAQFPLLVGLSLVLTVFSATQDIATDALTCRLLPAEQRGLGNSVQVAGGLIGILFGGGALLALYPTLGWSGCMALMAGILALSLVQILLFREPPADKPVGAPRPGYARLWSFWRQPGTAGWVLVMVTMPVGIGMTFGVLTPMLVDVGWSLERVGFALNIVGSLVGLVAVFAAGWLLQRFGRRRVLVAAALAQALIILSVLPLAGGASSEMVVMPSLALVFLIHNPLTTILVTIMMDRAGKGTEGTDFTAQYSLYSFMGFLSGAMALQIAGAAGYPAMILCAALVAFVAWGLAFRLYREAGGETGAVHPVDAGGLLPETGGRMR
ncbi:MFS transporter (plasmid) [Azospirillum humicireducens]|uniref:MFS transporter n=1 Tax=Azospirillum humicireducens TaxID=1226968 RepID=A0A2R4VTS8_9PROT|nr:MFS transporter [Azospirillum humicireducens]AWB07845.1 MFS transporter [Azospirillum humicireducens]